MLALATLLCLVPTVAAALDRSALQQDLPQDVQGVLLLDGGEALPAPSIAELPDTDLQAAVALWIWGEGLAPVRLEAGQQFNFEPPASPTWLTVRIDGDAQSTAASRSSEPPPRWVISAPPAMWQEVPERWLPRWPVGAKGSARLPVDSGAKSWRLRYTSVGRGSWWHDVAPSAGRIVLAEELAAPVELLVHGASAEVLLDAHARVLAPASRRARQRVALAMSSPDSSGKIRFDAVPKNRPIQLLVEHPAHAPRYLDSTAQRLPAEVSLAAGGLLRGRFLDADRKPVSNVAVVVEAWLQEDVPYPLTWSAEPNESGAWSVGGLPRGEVLLQAHGEGWVPVSVVVDLGAGEQDLGEMFLDSGHRLLVSVVNNLGEPVVGARVGADRNQSVLTDRTGAAVVPNVPGHEPVLVVDADGHLATSKQLSSPLPEQVEVTLTRSFRVIGQLLDEEGRTPQSPSALIIVGNRSQDLDLPTDGQLQLELPPGEPVELTLRSTSTMPVKLRLTPGSPGEQRDLGTISAASGVTVRGWVLAGKDGAAIRGARIHSQRASEEGPIIAWMRKETLEARTDADGAFEISGLSPGFISLQIEAHGAALKRITLDAGDERELDLGEIFLDEGSTLEVLTSKGEGLIAHLDLEGSGLPMNLISRPVEEGVARFEHVPPGFSELSIYRGSVLVCRREVEIPEGEAEVECPGEPLVVTGTVTVGGSRSGTATLLWKTPSRGVPEGILNHVTEGGLRQQESFTSLHPEALVQVDEEGTFRSQDLSPGTWKVTRLIPGSDEASPSRTVELSSEPHQEIHLSFDGIAVDGWVVDAQGAPVAGARIRELSAGTQAVSRPDGSFRISGLAPGTLVLQARKENLRSDLTEVVLEHGRAPEDVWLVLVSDERDQVEVAVLDSARNPASAALVFLETGVSQPDLQTADLQGLVRFRQDGKKPARVRAAAFHQGRWVLGVWVTWEKASEEGLRLEIAPVGSVLVQVEDERGVVEIQGPGGWNLTNLMSWIGARPLAASNAPLILSGLPAGSYRFALGQRSVFVTVSEDEVAEVELH